MLTNLSFSIQYTFKCSNCGKIITPPPIQVGSQEPVPYPFQPAGWNYIDGRNICDQHVITIEALK